LAGSVSPPEPGAIATGGVVLQIGSLRRFPAVELVISR
jgi:hypothetical protein